MISNYFGDYNLSKEKSHKLIILNFQQFPVM